jgi:hypothetical protein
VSARFLKGTTDHDGDGRMGGSLKETDMTRDATEQAAYDQGAHARAVSIPRDSDPHGKASKLQKHWRAGWDDADKERGTAGPLDNAVVNNPNADQSGDNAGGQAKTASKAKAKK